ncbi:hypothetical protein ESCOCP298B2_24980 [Escherichia coli]
MQAKEKSSYQTEDEKRGNGWKYLGIRRSLKECLMRRLMNWTPKPGQFQLTGFLILSPAFYRAESPKTEFYSFLIPVSYVFVNGIFQLFYTSVVPAIVNFFFQVTKEILHYRIIKTVALARHALH